MPFHSLDPDADLFGGDFTDPMMFEWLVRGANQGGRTDPNAQFSFSDSQEDVAREFGRIFGGFGGEGGSNPAAFFNPATAIINVLSGIDNIDPVTIEDVNEQVNQWVSKNPNPRKPIPRPERITINEDTGYIKRDDMTREQIETAIENGQLSVYTNPDGSRVVLDKEGFYQDYPQQSEDSAGGGSSGGGGSQGGSEGGQAGGGQNPNEPNQGNPTTGGGDIDIIESDEYVYPNERIITENARPVREYQNPDGSTVVEYSDGSTQWGQAPTETPPEFDLEGPYSREQILTHTEGMSWPEVYEAFIEFGVPIADANKVFGWEPGTAEAWIEANIPTDDPIISDPAPDYGEDMPGDGVPADGAGDGPGDDTGGGPGDGTGDGPGSGPGPVSDPPGPEGPGDGDGEEPGDSPDPGEMLTRILSPTRTTDALFAPELQEFKRGRLVENLLSYRR